MTFLNYTPHKINLNNGESFESLGVARVASEFTDIEDSICKVIYGEVQGLPEPQDGVKLIVSAMVLSASDREDLVAPATGHPETIRNDEEQVESVPYLVEKRRKRRLGLLV